MKKGIIILAACFVILGFRSLKNKELNIHSIPEGFPKVEHPVGNELNFDRWILGKKLFFNPVLSRDSSISCASCHLPSHAFSDTLKSSLGVEERVGVRNAPSLANVAYHPYFTKDGGVPSLEMQVLVPVQDHLEFDFNIVDISDRLMRIPEYVELCQKAYSRIPDPFCITRSISTFERTLLSGNSKYDRLVRGDSSNWTLSEYRGLKLFFGNKANCSNCHSGFNFTNYEIVNNGLRINYADSGRMRITHLEQDRAKFKVPSLRNIELTAPYMHDGSLEDLNAVMNHYSEGIQDHKNLDSRLKRLKFSEIEKSDLIAFLNTLTDTEFCSNELFK